MDQTLSTNFDVALEDVSPKPRKPRRKPDLTFAIKAIDVEKMGVIPRATGIAVVTIIAEYYDPKNKIRCSFCKRRTSHGWGLVVKLATGELAPIGNHCGARFIDGWQGLWNDHEDTMQRRHFQLRILPRLKGIRKSRQLLGSNWTPALRDADRWLRGLDGKSPKLAKILRLAAERFDGELQKDVEERDFAAQQARDARVGDDHPDYGTPIIRWVKKRDIRFAGHQVLRGRPLIEMLESVELGLQNAQELLELPEVPRQSYLHVQRTLIKARQDLIELRDRYKAFCDFATEANFKDIVAWAARTNTGQYMISEGCLQAATGNGPKLPLPTTFRGLDFAAVDELRGTSADQAEDRAAAE